MENKYRDSLNSKEICNHFKKSDSAKSFIWQNIAGIRKIHYLDRIEVNDTLKIIRIFPISPIEHLDIYDYFFIKLSYQDTICKTKYLSHDASSITLYIPNFIKATEARKLPRVKFRPKENRTVNLIVSSDITSKSTQAIKTKIIDINKYGLGTLSLKNTSELIKNSADILLTHLDDIKLARPIVLQEKYSKDLKVERNGRTKIFYRNGFQFADPLLDMDFDYFLMK